MPVVGIDPFDIAGDEGLEVGIHLGDSCSGDESAIDSLGEEDDVLATGHRSQRRVEGRELIEILGRVDGVGILVGALHAQADGAHMFVNHGIVIPQLAGYLVRPDFEWDESAENEVDIVLNDVGRLLQPQTRDHVTGVDTVRREICQQLEATNARIGRDRDQIFRQ